MLLNKTSITMETVNTEIVNRKNPLFNWAIEQIYVKARQSQNILPV